MTVKIAMIGAGSVEFTRCLVRDVLAVPELQDTHFALMDISEHNLDMVAQLCNPEEVWQLTDEMLVAQAQWLPNYAPKEIDAARARLERAELEGTRVGLVDTEGAARLRTRTVEELAEERRAIR